MRKKSILLAIPVGLLVLGLVLAGCDHGPAPVPPVTEGIAYAGEYGSLGATGWHISYANNGPIKIGQEDEEGEVDWDHATNVFWGTSLSQRKNFKDDSGIPLGEVAVVLNGEKQPGGLVIQIYETPTGKATEKTGVWIGIGAGTASLVTELYNSISNLINSDDTSAVNAVISQQATATTEYFVGKK
jgi:hypothetical protein